MPYAPARPCAYPKCPNTTDRGRYCPEHTTINNRQYKKDRWDKDIQALYKSSAWRRLRELKIQEQPLCERCVTNGIFVAVEVVHHKKEIKKGGRMLPTLDELESLCKACHNREHHGNGGR